MPFFFIKGRICAKLWLQVVPIAGCSLELLDLLCRVIDAVHERDDPEYLSESHVKLLHCLELRLRGIKQHHSGVFPAQSSGEEDAENSEKVAELYRLATLIYLFVIAKGDPIGFEDTKQAIDKAFGILQMVECCERPWPLFIIGMVAQTEDQRLHLLTVFDKSLALQSSGSMALANRMIRDAWVRQDLSQNGELDLFKLFSRVISRNRVPPCFT